MVRCRRGAQFPSPTVSLPVDKLSEGKFQTEFRSTLHIYEQAGTRIVLVCILGLMTPQLSGIQVFCLHGRCKKMLVAEFSYPGGSDNRIFQ